VRDSATNIAPPGLIDAFVSRTSVHGGTTHYIEENVNLIKITGEDGYLLAINADQIEHVRYRPATGNEDVSRVEIMFVGNPERTLFDGRVAEQFWKILTEQQTMQSSAGSSTLKRALLT